MNHIGSRDMHVIKVCLSTCTPINDPRNIPEAVDELRLSLPAPKTLAYGIKIQRYLRKQWR